METGRWQKAALCQPRDFLIYGHNTQIVHYECDAHVETPLSAVLFLSSTQNSPNLKFIKKMPIFEQLKNEDLVNTKPFLTPLQKDLDRQKLFKIMVHKIQRKPALGCNFVVFLKDANLGSVSSSFSEDLGQPELSDWLSR